MALIVVCSLLLKDHLLLIYNALILANYTLHNYSENLVAPILLCT